MSMTAEETTNFVEEAHLQDVCRLVVVVVVASPACCLLLQLKRLVGLVHNASMRAINPLSSSRVLCNTKMQPSIFLKYLLPYFTSAFLGT